MNTHLIQGGRHVDEGGSVSFVNAFDFRQFLALPFRTKAAKIAPMKMLAEIAKDAWELPPVQR